ncbi:hypothetical protein Vretimale_1977 [Volvox reticuliferus]|uniref:Uncharacterized protein n=1 Tax=Volvox reticuliferus TaxID=1737510 RepID=A0A8J4C2J1_9CHLO|nr:hypothetical protein Vretifemale_4243 [Volvox reticuliferus]GIL96097.1 hypothetical protein Vretimale_1977 [Volvox reticuliferus]
MGKMGRISELEVSTLTPENFWASHVAARKPALIHGHPTDMAWRASSLWTDEYMIRRAGDASVLVEVRGGPQDGYGRGVKRRMKVGEFVRRMAAGETGLYMTAQQVAVAPDGHPRLLAEPLLSLAGGGSSTRKNAGEHGGGGSSEGGCAATADFPASLELAGHLVPQSLNLWMGAAPEGSSSGLHHDFHDNIYVLLRGKKRFRLYPPTAAPTMYTHGKLARMYDNGRIVYEQQGDVLADGTDAADVARWRRRTEAEAAFAEAEAAVARGEKGAQARLAQSEAALEAALEADLSDAMEDDEVRFSGDGLSEEDLDMEPGSNQDDDEDEDEDEDEDADGVEVGEQERETARGGGARSGQARDSFGRGSSTLNAENKHAVRAGGETGGGDGDLIVDADTPPSFSRVPMGDPRVSDAQLAAEFPRFPGRAAALEVVVEAGEMLYLPAGWFHEVTSYGSPGGKNGGHLAFNYWFHPPDNLNPSRRGFRAPYSSDFWPSLWRARVAEGLPGGMEFGMGAQPPPSSSPSLPAADGDTVKANGDGGDEGKAGVVRNATQQKDSQGVRRQQLGGGGCTGGAETRRGKRSRLDGTTSGDNACHEEQRYEQQPDGDADRDGDLDPPRRRPAAAARALMAKLAEAKAGGAGGSDGAAAVELTDEEYQLLLAMEEARRRNTAVQAMRAFFEKHMKLQRIRRMRSRLPPGRRHHPVIAVGPEVRSWRPKKLATQQKQQQEDEEQKE